MKIGDRVEWTSQSAGVTRTKIGEIVDVVPAGTIPQKRSAINPGFSRNHESYIVRAEAEGRKGTRVYWPRVSGLKLITVWAHRVVEKFTAASSNGDRSVFGSWDPIEFSQLQKGDIFRLWDVREDGSRYPDHLIDGKHDVSVALDVAYKTPDGKGTHTYGVKSLSVRGFG